MNNKDASIPNIVVRAFRLMDNEIRMKSAISALLSVINAVIETASLLLVFPLVLALTDGNLDALDDRLSPVKSIILAVHQDNPMIGTGVLLVVAIIIKNVTFLLQSWWQLGFVREGAARFNCRLLACYMSNPYLWHLQRNSAELQRNVVSCSVTVFNQVIYQTLTFFSEIAIIAGAISALIYMEPVVSLLFFVFILVSGLIYHFSFSRISSHKGRVMQDASKNALMAVIQALGAYKEARLLRREQFLLDTFRHEVYRQSGAARVTSMIAQLPRSFLELSLILVVLFALFWVSSEYGPGTGVALIGLFVAAAFRIMPIISRVLSYGQTVKVAAAALDIVEEDLTHSSRGTTPASETRASVNDENNPAFTKSLEVRNVDFSFPQTEERVLKQVNISIQRGQCIGIVGATGAGKSTMVDLMMGFIHPDQGAVLLDGVDVSGNPGIWGGRLGYVPQSVYLLDNTVRRNVAFGLADADIDDDLVRTCLEKAQLLDFVQTLPNGLDNPVGERGVRLSGGQRQRIGIARALYSNPDILILDEGTSALDVETEARLSIAIEQLREDKTIILIAHRLSTVKHCDKLIFMDHGEVVDQGSFGHLASTNEKFIDLLRLANVEVPSAANG